MYYTILHALLVIPVMSYRLHGGHPEHHGFPVPGHTVRQLCYP